jgi:hypothetical protein
MFFIFKKIFFTLPSTLISVLFTIYSFLYQKLYIKKYFKNKKFDFLEVNELKKLDLEKPFFILGTGTTINELTHEEKKYIENSNSVGINLFVLSDINPKFLTWEAPKNRDIESLYLNILAQKDEKFNRQNPKLLLYDNYIDSKYDIYKLYKHFNDIKIYSKATIFYLKKNDLAKIYHYLFHPLVLKLLGQSSVYGFQSTVDRLTNLVMVAGFKKIVFAGIDLNNSSNFWDEINLDYKIRSELDRLIYKDKNNPHSTEQKKSVISASEIIKIQNQYANSKGIKFYTTSKNSKLSSFLPQYQFPKIDHE